MTDRMWTFVRRPLLLAFVLGCTVSLQASGRFSLRLVADGMISFAFVPIFMLTAIAIVYRRTSRQVDLPHAVDLFFAANRPWLLWLIGFGLLRSFQTPLQAAAPPWSLVCAVLLSVLPILVWSASVDLRFFRETLPGPRRPGRQLALVRALSWTPILAWYLGHEFWELVAERIGI
jgi:hypothetical protein